eukprot:TRINITY_DN22577_c0_g2_i1.p1 TRINITY_DN22577_c0_g2~~TRINITY_DN22577_c0_g2_i1.p1  ORF type:complete len:1594 (+),score=244.66 TRINITY_DN22577_c0_g2_i1:990-5771(+)
MQSRGSEPAWSGLRLYEVQAFGKEVNATEQTVLYLDRPLVDEHWGGFRDVQGHSFEMAAEVVNLERKVLITGDHDDFFQTHQGLHTIMSGQGIMDVRYARIEYCGQRDFMGKYCMHLHHGSHCPECVFQGNAIVEGSQVGITVHGTHRALIDSNVLWDTAAAGLYTEDGNEMYNTFSGNVFICSHWEKCSVPWLGRVGQNAAFYLIGMTNNIIDNRVAGWENGIWTVGSIAQDGQGKALNRVCPQHTPFGTIRGNVNHDCARFGLYLDNQYPRNLERDKDGFVTDMGSCAEFTSTGKDNGVVPANVIEDEFDWHNQFVGQYSMGDIAFVRLVSVNNAHNVYWKESKNFADSSATHIKDSIFANDPSDTIYGNLQFYGPAGPFTFTMKNSSFVGGPVGCGALCAAQHCGLVGAGGPCTVQYLLSGVDFSQVLPGQKRIKFGVNTVDIGYVQPMFMSDDDSLGGHRTLVSSFLNGFTKVDGCEATNSVLWDNAIGCKVPVRRLNIWAEDLGNLTLKGPGYDVEPDETSIVRGMNAGNLLFEHMHGGYGAPVVVGGNYSLNGKLYGDLATELSDVLVEKTFGSDEEINVSIGDIPCTLSAKDDRSYLGVHGPPPETYLPRHCLTAAFQVLQSKISSTTTTTSISTTGGNAGTCQEEAEVACCPDGSCEERCTGGSQCCPSPQGSRTCPSSSVLEVPVCSLGKAFDCTGKTGIAPPGRRDGSCQWPNEPAIPYFWDPWCSFGQLGCFADGVNVECRFCGAGDFESIACPTSTTTTTTRSTTATTAVTTTSTLATTTTTSSSSTVPYFPCSTLGGVLQNCSADGCKVLVGGLTDRTCNDYCGNYGMECKGAWEDMENDCNIKGTLQCNEAWPGTSDLICECDPSSATSTAAPTQETYVIQDSSSLHCLEALEMNRSGAPVDLHVCRVVAPISDRWFQDPTTMQLKSAGSGGVLCLHAAERTVAGGLLVLWPCNPEEPAQRWVYNETSLRLQNGVDGLCLDSLWQSVDENGKVQTWTCMSQSESPQHAENQQWHFQKAIKTTTTTTTTTPESWLINAPWGQPGESQTGLVLHGTLLCLSVANYMSDDGKPEMKSCNRSDPAQNLNYNASLRQLRISNGTCIEANLGEIRTWTCDPKNLNQQWAYSNVSGLFWNRNFRCIDYWPTGGVVHTWNCDPENGNQKFLLSPAPPPGSIVKGQIQLNTGICLDAMQFNTSNSRLQMSGCNNSDPGQEWLYDPQTFQFKNTGGKCLVAPHANGINEKVPIVLSPVDGGFNRACRGMTTRDNSKDNFYAKTASDLDACQKLCARDIKCTGIEFNPGLKRCEVWMTTRDNSKDNFYAKTASDLDACQKLCARDIKCTGIEFNPGLKRCEVWVKPVQASVGATNFQCYTAKFEDDTLAVFEAVDGGQNRVCRGDDQDDNSRTYFTVSNAASQMECKHQCAVETGQCTGFEFSPSGRCELWSKPVGASRAASGYFCGALATVMMAECNQSDLRQQWEFNENSGLIKSQQAGACIDSVGTGKEEGGRVRLLICNEASTSQIWQLRPLPLDFSDFLPPDLPSNLHTESARINKAPMIQPEQEDIQHPSARRRRRELRPFERI